MTKHSNQLFIGSFLLLFVISTIIVLVASTAKNPIPAWGGYLDVGIVFLIAVCGFMIHRRNANEPRYDVGYQIALYLFPLILVGAWVFRNSLDFNILLPGLAWRAYFFLAIVPHALALWKSEQHS
jgi:hypothetical protein